jgi:protein tyrosine phosphatase
MSKVNRNASGLRDAMFDVLDQLRAGQITARQARAQMDAVKHVCLTLQYERQEVQLIKEQIELDEKMRLIQGQVNHRSIEHVSVNH